jgi:hypothetical protein
MFLMGYFERQLRPPSEVFQTWPFAVFSTPFCGSENSMRVMSSVETEATFVQL